MFEAGNILPAAIHSHLFCRKVIPLRCAGSATAAYSPDTTGRCIMNDDVVKLFPYFFPVLFIGMWLAISTLLGFFSGWFGLQRHYRPRDEPALLTLRGRSGSMGMGVALNGILTLSACPSGLRISIWKIFGPFQRPLFIPWTDIRTTSSRSFLVSTVKLTFGTPPVGTLKIDACSWERLHHTADNSGAEGLPSALPSVSKGAAGRVMVLQWAVATLAGGCFFYFAPRLQGSPTTIPVAMCFGFPAVLFGFGTVVRFIRQA